MPPREVLHDVLLEYTDGDFRMPDLETIRNSRQPLSGRSNGQLLMSVTILVSLVAVAIVLVVSG